MITTREIAYRDGDAELLGILLTEDERPERRPGILVVHGGAGLDDHARGRAKRMADLGFVVFACDMYGSNTRGSRERILASLREFQEDAEKLCKRARSGLNVLASCPLVDGRIAAVGYCFGGLAVLQMARAGMDLTGVVSVHGSLSTSRPAMAGAIRAKVLVCHGALDPHVPLAQVNAFMEEMNQARADWELIIYGGAMHGFTHDSGPAIPGVAYHAIADARSAIAIRNFLSEIFGEH
jgi:dienelactone hydrolase